MIICIENNNTKEHALSYQIAERLYCSRMILVPLPQCHISRSMRNNPFFIKSKLYMKCENTIISVRDIQKANQYHEAGLHVILEGQFECGVGALIHQFWPSADLLSMIICDESRYQNPPTIPVDCIIDIQQMNEYQIIQIIGRKILQARLSTHKDQT